MMWLVGAVWEHTRCERKANLGEIYNAISEGNLTPHPLSININQLYAAANRAEQDGLLKITRNNSLIKHQLQLTDRACEEILNSELEARKTAELAYEEWKSALLTLLGDEALGIDSLHKLWDAVVDTIPHLVDYLESSFTGKDYYINMEEWARNTNFPAEFHDVYFTAAKLFISLATSSSSSACRKLFNIILLNALYAYRTTIPREIEERIKKQFSRRVIFLDTNVLFALAGVTGDEVWESAVRGFAKAASLLGFKLKYTRRTAEEYSTTIVREVDKLTRPSPEGPVDPIHWSHLPPSIKRAFYQDNIDVVHFKARYKDPVSALKEHCPEVPIELDQHYDEHYIERIHELYGDEFEHIYKVIEERPRKRDKSDIVVQHDAIMVALVSMLNTDSEQFYFITADNALIKINNPYVLGIDQWFALYGPAISAVDNYDDYLFTVTARTRFPAFYIHPSMGEEFASFISKGTNANDRETIEAHLVYTRQALGHYIHRKNNNTFDDLITQPEYSPEDYAAAIELARKKYYSWAKEEKYKEKLQEQDDKLADLSAKKARLSDLAAKMAHAHEQINVVREEISQIDERCSAKIEDLEQQMSRANRMVIFLRAYMAIVAIVFLYKIYYVHKSFQIDISTIILLLTAVLAFPEATMQFRAKSILYSINKVKNQCKDEISKKKNQIVKLEKEISSYNEQLSRL